MIAIEEVITIEMYNITHDIYINKTNVCLFVFTEYKFIRWHNVMVTSICSPVLFELL